MRGFHFGHRRLRLECRLLGRFRERRIELPVEGDRDLSHVPHGLNAPEFPLDYARRRDFGNLAVGILGEVPHLHHICRELCRLLIQDLVGEL